MHYENPNYFSLIFFSMLILIIFYLWAVRRRRVIAQRFAEKGLMKEIAPSVSARRKNAKWIILLTAVFLALLALARPQWGFEWEEVKRSGLDVLIAVDVSKSMLAKDVKPNRLERSKFAIKDLSKKLSGDRIGLIAFAGTAFLQCPLTIDYNGFLLSLEDLNTGTIPRGGTSIEGAIREAIRVFSGDTTSLLGGKKSDKKYKVLVIITDGEELEGSAVDAANEASRLGIKIYTIGVGTSEGELIPQRADRGQAGYLADDAGNIVKTKLNEDLLKRIAILAGGAYIRATQSEFGLVLLYDKIISKLEKKDIESKMKKRYQERFQIFLAVALFLLSIEPFISERKRLAL